MFKEFNLYLNITILCLTLILGTLIFIRGKKEISTKILASLFIATALWVLCLIISDNVKSLRIVEIAIKSAIVAPAFIPLIILIMSLTFPTAKTRLTKLQLFLLSIPTLIILAFAPTDFNAKNISVQSWGSDLTPGPLYTFFLIFFLAYLGVAFFNLYKKYMQEPDKKKKRQILLLLIGIIGSAVIGIGTNVVSVILGMAQIGNYGPMAGLFVSLAVFYTISEHQLLNIRLIISESLIYFIILILTVELFFSTSTVNLIFKALFIVMTIIIGQSSLRAIREEIKQKERLDRLSHELEKANEHLQEVDKLKDDFLSMASHELNTPIAAIKGYLSMILVEGLGGKIPDKARTYLDSVFQSATRLANMVKDLLNVSRIESGRIHIIWEQKPIEDVITQSITEVMSKAREAKHSLTFETPKHKMPPTWFDVTRVTEVLINIIGNSIKYTPDGGKIVVRVINDDQKIVISVEDNGKGIPKERQEAVFEKFTQVDVLKDEVKGTGLGMYIAKKFVELQKGKIWFHSDGADKGTTFFFSMPILNKKPYDAHDGEGDVLH